MDGEALLVKRVDQPSNRRRVASLAFDVDRRILGRKACEDSLVMDLDDVHLMLAELRHDGGQRPRPILELDPKPGHPAGPGKVPQKDVGEEMGVDISARQDEADLAPPEPILIGDQGGEADRCGALDDGPLGSGEKPDRMFDVALGDEGRLNVRILSYASGIDNLLAVAGRGPTPWLYDSRLRMVGVKLYLDGALGSRGAWLKQDYRDAPGQRGLPLTSETELKNLMSRAAMDNVQVAVHAIGDAANAQLLDAIDELSATYRGDRRWRIEHAQIVDPADLPRFRAHGTIASMQPVHQTSDWQMAEARMGIDRLQGAYAWRSLLGHGVPLAFGSDFPVEHPNPFHGLAAAISRQDAQGQPPGGWLPAQRVTLEQAFHAFTRGAAYAAFAEDRLGSLEPGRLADFLFIDRDIFRTSNPNEIRDTQVLETWLGGTKVWDRGSSRNTERARP